MSLLDWTLFGLAALVAIGYAAVLYFRREPAGVRRRRALFALRAAALALLVLLLFDPELPLGRDSGGGERAVLLDRSLSMELPAAAGGTRWNAAVEAVPARTDRVLAFGEGVRGVSRDSLRSLEPGASSSRLLPALQAAAEAGARSALVITDGALEDAHATAAQAEELGVGLEVRRVGASLRDRAIAQVAAPGWAEAGSEITIEADVVALDLAGDSATVVARQGERELARTRVRLPRPHETAPVALRLRAEPAGGDGWVRYDVAFETPDSVPATDLRSVYVFVTERPAGIVLLSLRPDWEPRFLLPVLEQSLGMPARGYLRAGDRYIRLGRGTDAGVAASEAQVRAAVAGAELLVLQGSGAAAPEWLARAASAAQRLILLPPLIEPALPLPVPPPTTGDWYAAPELPASPVAPYLVGIPTDSLPPLAGLRLVEPGAGTWAPLLAARSRRGPPAPLILGGASGGRRWVVALGEGYWRWAMRGGVARESYRRLWGALAGWLVREERLAGAGPVRPVLRASPRAEPIRWALSGSRADSVAIRLIAAGETVGEHRLPWAEGDTVSMPAPPPGHYRYDARVLLAGEEIGRAEGPLTVETFSPEFVRLPVALETIGSARAARAAGVRRMPLHASPWPYVLLVLVLCAEWALRRRAGLR